VNARQYHRILKRRIQRAKLEQLETTKQKVIWRDGRGGEEEKGREGGRRGGEGRREAEEGGRERRERERRERERREREEKPYMRRGITTFFLFFVILILFIF
jgi:hypothetical protein